MSFVNFSFPLISRYLAGDASDSDSGDESGGDEDDDEPEESPKGESENQDDDKLDDSKYKKKVDDIKAKFAERFRKSNADISSVHEPQAETISATKDRGAQGCTAISMSGTRLRKDLFIVGRIEESHQNTSP